MWLSNSSIGRKVVMSVTGIALVLFLTFHMAMNLVALFSEDAYNMICEFLGANWYALVATAGLAALFVIHIIYAFWLTMQNRAARGSERYAVNVKPKTVEWASQNMLVLGIIVIAGLALHFANFWYKMQFAEIIDQYNQTTILELARTFSKKFTTGITTAFRIDYQFLFAQKLVGNIDGSVQITSAIALQIKNQIFHPFFLQFS